MHSHVDLIWKKQIFMFELWFATYKLICIELCSSQNPIWKLVPILNSKIPSTFLHILNKLIFCLIFTLVIVLLTLYLWSQKEKFAIWNRKENRMGSVLILVNTSQEWAIHIRVKINNLHKIFKEQKIKMNAYA